VKKGYAAVIPFLNNLKTKRQGEGSAAEEFLQKQHLLKAQKQRHYHRQT
jgi:hypothetical protein